MRNQNLIQFCAGLEEKLDTCLFRQRDEEDEEKRSSMAKQVATTAAVGAGSYLAPGAVRAVRDAHGSVMANYGGMASGSAANAYREAGRNAVRSAVAPAQAAATRAGTAYTTAREIGGLNPVASGLRAGRKAINPALARLRGVLARVSRA